ncbi:MAG TPA: hypothetical protein VFX96_02390 [Pyrinomonadaceae bacterium]|nr:hypothetical protein [Pyrinomonadaceae bacterium]
MRRSFVIYFAALVFALALTLSSPFTTRTVNSADLQEKCDDCNIRNNRQFEHCLTVHGINEQRCYDQFNEGVVHCFRNFCEQ